MTDNIIWYVLGVLAVVYLIIIYRNRSRSKRRKSRSFMEGKRKHSSRE